MGLGQDADSVREERTEGAVCQGVGAGGFRKGTRMKESELVS